MVFGVPYFGSNDGVVGGGSMPSVWPSSIPLHPSFTHSNFFGGFCYNPRASLGESVGANPRSQAQLIFLEGGGENLNNEKS